MQATDRCDSGEVDPEDVHLKGGDNMDKDWYLSKTLWGAIVMGIGGIGALITGHAILSSEEGVELVNAFVALAQAIAIIVGFIITVIGRIKAGKQIKSLRATIKRLDPHDISGEPNA